MTLQHDIERRNGLESIEPPTRYEPHEAHDPHGRNARHETLPKRILTRIKQGERYQAYAYFLSTIL